MFRFLGLFEALKYNRAPSRGEIPKVTILRLHVGPCLDPKSFSQLVPRDRDVCLLGAKSRR